MGKLCIQTGKAIQVLPWLPSLLKIAPPTEPCFSPCSQDVVVLGGASLLLVCFVFQVWLPWQQRAPSSPRSWSPWGRLISSY